MKFEDLRMVFRENSDSSGKWVYRGHANPSWALITSYGRFHQETFGESASFSLHSFQAMLTRFIRRASESCGQNYGSYSPAQKMSLAQHFGVPSPILDWTHSPYVATYFAVTDPSASGCQDISFCVYALNVKSWSDAELSAADEDTLLTGHGDAFRFLDTNSFFSRRITRQSGCFTYQNFPECLSKQIERPNETIRKYEVTDNRTEIIQELELMGITGGNLFDELDYVAKDVVQAERALQGRRRSNGA